MKILHLLEDRGGALYSIHPEATLVELMNKLNELDIGAMPVLDNGGALLGVVSERDILRKAPHGQGQACTMVVREIMTPAEKITTTTPEAELEEVMKVMASKNVRHIPVMDGPATIAFISMRDVIKSLLAQARRQNEELQNYMYGH